jgi:hypothetical protein
MMQASDAVGYLALIVSVIVAVTTCDDALQLLQPPAERRDGVHESCGCRLHASFIKASHPAWQPLD